MRLFSMHQGTRRGATVVEMAVVLSLTFLILLGVMEYGRYLMVRHVVDNASREGARMIAAATSTGATSSVTTAVTNKLLGMVPGATVQIYWVNPDTGANLGNWYDAPYGQGIAVQVTGSYSPMVPTFGILPNPMPVTHTSVMRSEANAS